MWGRVTYQDVYASDPLTLLLRIPTTLRISSFSPQYLIRGRATYQEVYTSDSSVLFIALLNYPADLIILAFSILYGEEIYLFLIIYYRWSLPFLPPRRLIASPSPIFYLKI